MKITFKLTVMMAIMWTALQAGALTTNVWSYTNSVCSVGKGPWDTSTSNWWVSGAAAPWINDGNVIASFSAAGAASSTVTVSGAISAAGLLFPSNDVYVLTGAGTLALANNGMIQYANDGKVVISNTLSGNNLSIKTTSGADCSITLAGSNQLTGTTTLLGNYVRLYVQNLAALGTSTIDCGTGGALWFPVGGVFSNDIRIGYSNPSSAVLRFDSDNTTLRGTITLLGDSFIGANNPGYSEKIDGPIIEGSVGRSLTFGNGFAFWLSGASTYTGATTNYSYAYINLTNGNDRLPPTTIYVNRVDGKLVLRGISQTLAGLSGPANSFVLGGAATASSLILNVGTGAYTFSGSIGTPNGFQHNLAVTKSGSGTQVLSGTNTYSGATTVSNGTLKLGASFSASTNSAVTVAGGVYDLGTITATNKTAAMSGGAISNGTLVAGSFTFSGGTAYAGLAGAGSLTNVAGTTTLAGTNTYTGATVITNGTLVVNGLYAGGGTVTVLSNATLQGTSPISNLLCLAGGILSAPATNAVLTVGNGGTLGLTNAVLAVTVDAAGNSGKLAVNGNLVMTNCTVSVTGTNLLDYHKEYIIATWTGPGPISPITGNLPTGWHAVAEANRIILQGRPSGFVLNIQ